VKKIDNSRIIFIQLLNDFSGSPKVLSQVVRAIQSTNIEIEIFTGSQTNGFLSNLTLNHQYFFYKRFENKCFTLFSFLFSQIILFIKLLKYWRKDVIIYVNTMLPFGAGLAGKLMGKPVIYHIHETTLSPPGLKIFLRKVIHFSSQKNIFVSHSVKNLESFDGLFQSVVYNALPSNFAEITVNQVYSPFCKEQFNVLMISSMKAYKGVFEFIEIARKLQNKKEITHTLVLNAFQDEIDTFFEKIALPSNIKIYSQQKDVIPFYLNSSLVLNLSRIDEWIETFGLTILEALAFGIPVIVPPVGGPSEIVFDGKEGFLISSYEIDAIAQKIAFLSINPEICFELSRNAKKRSLDFMEEEFNAKILKFLNA
jgi:glycosyltransferase involved in cell wall biosynthesis